MANKIHFTTESNISKFNNNYIPLSDLELTVFSDSLSEVKVLLDKTSLSIKNNIDPVLLNVKNRLIKLVPDDVKFDFGAIFLIELIINVSKKIAPEGYEEHLFSFGIFVNKIIIENYGGKLIRNIKTGDIDVIVNGIIFSPHEAIFHLLADQPEKQDCLTCLIIQVEDRIAMMNTKIEL